MSVRKSIAGKSVKTAEWLVYRLGGPKATLLGHIKAPNRETALAMAYEEFSVVTPRDRQRIIVQRTSQT